MEREECFPCTVNGISYFERHCVADEDDDPQEYLEDVFDEEPDENYCGCSDPSCPCEGDKTFRRYH